MIGLYNNDAKLFTPLKGKEEWKNFRIIKGHIWSPRNGYVARCKDDSDAAHILTEAGFTKDETGLWN